MTDRDLGSREVLYKATIFTISRQTNTSIREGWFYRDDTNQKVRSADDVLIYTNVLLEVIQSFTEYSAKQEGKFSPRDVEDA